MSFDDYVRHMTQKYRLATAIAVLKSKPPTVPVEQYIDVLRNKIKEQKMDKDDMDFSLGSDDFNFDDDDVIINDGDDDFIDNNDDKAERESLNDSVTILKDVNMDIESNDNVGHDFNSFENVMNILKEVDGYNETASTIVEDNMTQRTYCESSQSQSIALTLDYTNAINMDVEMLDLNNARTDETQELIFNENRLANAINNNLNETVDSERNHIDSYDFNKETAQNNTMQRTIARTVFKNLSKDANESVRKKAENIEVNNKPVKTFDNYNKTLISSQSTKEDDNIFSESQIVVTNHDIMVNKVRQNLEKSYQSCKDDSQSTVLYSLPGYTQNLTHVSQSQYDIVQVADNFIHGRCKIDEAHRFSTETHDSTNPYSIDKDKVKLLDTNAGENNQMYGNANITYAPQVINVDSSEIQYVIDKSGRTYRVLEGFNTMGNCIETMNAKDQVHEEKEASKEAIAIQEVIATNNNALSPRNATSLEVLNATAETNDTKETTDGETQNTQMTQDLDEFDEDLTASQKEVIPFKVIEELNKIKTFLTRKMDRRASTDGFSTDSGYRSDSQSKSSFKSALQLTGNAVNQSAHCLYTYLLQCPLVGSTEDITQEIATVLGKLVDKLHETEKYPTFLEDILDSIDNMLKDISEGENFGETVILTKDENIQRLLLLNKSPHVIKYTIEKITNLLEKLHTFLTNEANLYEITDIDATENACYVFHILEVLIKRYRKTKMQDFLSQNSTQNSQESEGILKKSSITDIWRKKWNPENKIVKNESSIDKKCVLTKVGEVLNKIIVDCMEGYSLISFAALQCFNLLQS